MRRLVAFLFNRPLVWVMSDNQSDIELRLAYSFVTQPTGRVWYVKLWCGRESLRRSGACRHGQWIPANAVAERLIPRDL